MSGQSTPKLEAVVLDWDNTLHDSAAVNFVALRQVLADAGIQITEADYRRAYTTDYRRLYQRLGLPASEVEAASDQWRMLVGRESPRLLPGAEAALDALASAGIRVALLTTGPRTTVAAQVEQLGLATRFAAMTFGDGQPPRPDPAPLRETLAKLDVPASATVLCSDAPADMRMAGAAGVRAVGVATFVADETALRGAGADETAPRLLDWVERKLLAPSNARRRPSP